jgi:hypothetical protein
MKKHWISLLGSFILFGALLSACNGYSPATVPTTDPYILLQTVEAEQTLAALQTQINQPTNGLPTVNPSTATPSATVTSTPYPTNTPIQIRCDAAQYVADVTIPDGTSLSTGQSFTKTWRIRNNGSCTWTSGYSLVFVSGNALSGPARVAFTSSVAPGATVDLSVTLVAPTSSGTYTGYWMLQNASGATFGIGADASTAFWVNIKVPSLSSGYTSDAVPAANPVYAYDFTANICSAAWVSSSGKITYPCTGHTTKELAWVAVLLNPKLEGGIQENERTLWFHPDETNGGWIKGTYPAYAVVDKDHFIADIGCLDSAKSCNVTFSLDYVIGGGVVTNLGTWREVNDGNRTRVDIDLSAMAGQNVQFILTVSSNVTTHEPDAFWFVPTIINVP